MRKIVSKYEAEKKRRKNQLIVGGVLIAVMFLSVLGYAFQNNGLLGGNTNSNITQTVTYNNIDFSNQNGFWVVNSGNNRLVFTYNPTEINLSNLTGLTTRISDISGKPLLIYSDNNLNAESEMKLNLKNFASSITSACPSGMLCNNTNGTIIPTGSCDSNFIIIQNGTSGVKQENKCIYISGQGEDLIKEIDNVLFKMLGIEK